MKNEQSQRRIIAAALFPTMSHAMVPSTYEQLLADRYIEGTLTIYQSVELLEEYQRKTQNKAVRF
jgi:hypothetical protein